MNADKKAEDVAESGDILCLVLKTTGTTGINVCMIF